MPQLKTSTWFCVMVMAWAIILLFLVTKMTHFLQPNEPSSITFSSHLKHPWNWPW
nr:ATP synthase F0 subunit 8 [Nezumia stelgidolepis]